MRQELRCEQISTENISAATAQDEEEHVKELLSDDDLYLMGPDEGCDVSAETEEDYPIAASAVGELADNLVAATRPGQRLRV